MSYTDLVLWVIFAFAFAFILVSVKYSYDEVTGQLITITGDPNVSGYISAMDETWSYIDYVFLMSYISFITGSVILAFFVRSHLVFYVFFMVASFGLIFFSWIYYNVFEEFLLSNASFQTIFDQFGWTKRLITNMPTILLVFSTVIAIFQYSKPNVFKSYGFG